MLADSGAHNFGRALATIDRHQASTIDSGPDFGREWHNVGQHRSSSGRIGAGSPDRFARRLAQGLPNLGFVAGRDEIYSGTPANLAHGFGQEWPMATLGKSCGSTYTYTSHKSC